MPEHAVDRPRDEHEPDDSPDVSTPDGSTPVESTVGVYPAGSTADVARARLVHALVHPGRGQLVVAALLAVLGAAAVTQVRLAGSGDDYAGLRQADLIQALNGLQASTRRTEQDIGELEATRDSLRDSNDKTATALEQAQQQLTTLGILAGTLPAHGSGVRITVTAPDSGLSLNALLDGIEELRDAGAEAMEINDSVRVVAQTSFESANGGIDVDGRLLKSPYTIDVIGDPATLTPALKFPGGFVDDISLDEGKVTIKESKDIQVSTLRKASEPEYAEPSEPD